MIVTSQTQLAHFKEVLESHRGPIVFDVETNGVNWSGRNYEGELTRIIGYAFYFPGIRNKAGRSFYIPIRQRIHPVRCIEWVPLEKQPTPRKRLFPPGVERFPDGIVYEQRVIQEKFIDLNVPPAVMKELLAPVFSDPTRKIVGHNIKFDAHMVRVEGMAFECETYDTMLQAHLANENERSYGLKELSVWYVSPDAADEKSELVAWGKANGYPRITSRSKNADQSKVLMANLDKCPLFLVGDYAAQDCVLTWKLCEYYKDKMQKESPRLMPLWGEVNIYNDEVARMELAGVQVNKETCAEAIAYADQMVKSIYERMVDWTGEDFNPGSSEQVAKYIYGWEKPEHLPKGVRAKQPPVHKLALMNIEHPLAPMVLEHRQWDKALTTYYRPWLTKADENGLLHPNLMLIGTVAGRLSCREPNLQNLPRASPIYDVRRAIVAKPGMALVSFDYCLHPSTPVKTTKGVKPISEIEPGDFVFSYREGRIACNPVTESAPIPPLNAYRLTFDNGESVVASADHKWPTHDGIRTTEELSIGARMVPLRQTKGGEGYTHLYSDSAFRYSKEHLLVAEAHHGLRPPGFETHHKNRNKQDNHPDNLEYVPESVHRSLHGKESYASQDHAARIEALREGIKRRRSYNGEDNPNFGKRRGSYVSCWECGTEFYAYPSTPRKYCSPQCYHAAQSTGLNHKLVSKEPVGQQSMWAITVENDHNYALGCGVFTLNSQIELRVCAHYTEDPNMMAVYFDDEGDIHTLTSEMLGLDKWLGKKEGRQAAKTLNFAMLYGMGPRGLKSALYINSKGQLDVTLAEAKEKLQAFKESYPTIDRWCRRVTRFAEKKRYIELWTGRRRRYPRPRYYGDMDEAHTAVNNLIQGGAAEIMRHAICRLGRMFREHKSPVTMDLQIHDDILFSIPQDDVEFWLPRIKAVMESFEFNVPIKTECKVGSEWSTMVVRNDIKPYTGADLLLGGVS